MSTTNNNSIFFSSLDDISLSPLKPSNLNSQTQQRSFPILLQPKLQRSTPFSLLGSVQSCQRTYFIQELDFSFVSNTALKPYSERTSIVIDRAWAHTSTTPTVHIDKSAWKAQVTPQRNSVSPVYQLLDNTSPESSPVQKHSLVIYEHTHNDNNITQSSTLEHSNILSEDVLSKTQQQPLSTIKQSSTNTDISQRSPAVVERDNDDILEHHNLDTTQELTPAHQRSPFVTNKEWSHSSNIMQGPTPIVECRYSEHGFNRLSYTPQGLSFDADQSWSQVSPMEGYAQLPPIMILDREFDQIQRRSPVIIPEHEVSQQSNMQCVTKSYPQVESASTASLTLNQRLKQGQSNKENESESKEFACSECDKIYKGKNARSILRRHLKDKHKIEQPRGTRWDNDPNRPKTDEERRQRMLESKRRSALKARERKNNQRAMMQQSNNSQLVSRQSSLSSAPKVELSLILSPPRTPRNLCSSPVHYKIQ